MMKRRRKRARDVQELKRLTNAANRDGNDKLSVDEFVTLVKDPRFCEFLECRDLQVKDAEMFFNMLTSVTGDVEVDISTFIAGCLSMRGVASAMDLHSLYFEVKMMHIQHREFS